MTVSAAPLAPPGPRVDAPFASALVSAGHRRPDLVVLSADLSKYTDVADFAAAFPERFIQVGMAEQNLMGIAGGLAKTGFRPVAVTYCVFATRRAFEQVAMALTTGGPGAVVAAFLPGITTPFRATHQGTEDLALMRTLPGMTVIDPVDATELAAALDAAVDHTGPVYLRGLRGSVRRVLGPGHRFRIGAAYELLSGGDVGLIGTGLGTQWALDAAQLVAARGVRASLLHVPTLKPADEQAIAAYCARFPQVTTIENHTTVGGLGSVVADAVTATGLPTRIHRLGVPDRWAPAGSLDHVRRQLGLDAESLAAAVLTHHRQEARTS